MGSAEAIDYERLQIHSQNLVGHRAAAAFELVDVGLASEGDGLKRQKTFAVDHESVSADVRIGITAKFIKVGNTAYLENDVAKTAAGHARTDRRERTTLEVAFDVADGVPNPMHKPQSRRHITRA